MIVSSGYPYLGEGEYLIMVGPDLFEGDLAVDEPATLVHEMTHVWQYKHGTLTEFHAASAHVHYYVRGRTDQLYKYTLGDSWDDFGFEGQAQLVEDWYSLDEMSETSDRFVYVKKILLSGDWRAGNLTLDKLRDPPLPGEPQVDDRRVSFEDVPFSDSYLLGTLEQHFQPNDILGLAARVKKLEGYCRQLRRLRLSDALTLSARLEARPGDRVAQAFQYNLSTATRNDLIKILRGLA